MLLLETNFLKKKRNIYIVNAKGCDFLMSIVDIISNVEMTMKRLANKKGNGIFIKTGNTSLTPAMIWDNYLEHHRRV